MKKNKAELVFIVDRSGSMMSIASDMQGAIKSVLSDQKKNLKGDINVTFVRFDSEYEEVFSGRSINDVSETDLEINPRGMTSLLDAMGKTLNTFERRFSETDEKNRPKRVLFLIITDGQENNSKEYSRDKVFGMIKTLERDHEWGFTFIGANQDAISEGSSIGVARGKSLNYAASTKGVRCMARSVSNFTADYLESGDASYSDGDE
jgi:Mg-chelatase subunit ChlD